VKGKAPTRRTTRPRPRKVTRVLSPSPVIVEAPGPILGLPGLVLRRGHLFEESIPSAAVRWGPMFPVSLSE